MFVWAGILPSLSTVPFSAVKKLPLAISILVVPPARVAALWVVFQGC